MTVPAFFLESRKSFHAALLSSILKIHPTSGVPSNADGNNRPSVEIAKGIITRIGTGAMGARLAGQMSGNEFEEVVASYVRETFEKLGHLRPGTWDIRRVVKRRNQIGIAAFEQYSHLDDLALAASQNIELAAALGNEYVITPDVIIARLPEPDHVINAPIQLVDDDVTRLASLRAIHQTRPILHASISCKWTLRSDRAQNVRSEALNLVRNRKGPLPRVVAVTGEPLPSRLASLALGTGDIDCVYHFALDELRETVDALGYEDSKEMLEIMVQGKRMKDISDLPLDLAV